FQAATARELVKVRRTCGTEALTADPRGRWPAGAQRCRRTAPGTRKAGRCRPPGYRLWGGGHVGVRIDAWVGGGPGPAGGGDGPGALAPARGPALGTARA